MTAEIEAPRRFYREVAVGPAEDGFAVLLDGRAPKSPAGAPLVLPTRAIASLVAEEWDAQQTSIVPSTMPATRLAFTAIDRTPHVRQGLAAELANYAGSDLVCYLAESPSTLVERQTKLWRPLLDWARDDLGVELEQTRGIAHLDQDAAALARVEALAADLDDFTLTGVAHAAGLLGSAVLALALQRGRLNGEEAFVLSRVDEAFQEERWGVDAEAAERAGALGDQARLLERWFKALA